MVSGAPRVPVVGALQPALCVHVEPAMLSETPIHVRCKGFNSSPVDDTSVIELIGRVQPSEREDKVDYEGYRAKWAADGR